MNIFKKLISEIEKAAGHHKKRTHKKHAKHHAKRAKSGRFKKR